MSVEIKEPKGFKVESEFENFITEAVKTILSTFKKQGMISSYYVFRHLGFDLAVFIDKNEEPRVKFLELKLYKGQRAGGVGFGNQKGEGPQVEVLMNDKETLGFFNKFLRWVIYDALASSRRQYIFIDNIAAKKCAMGEVRKGKQNNFNINRLRRYAITWDELLRKIEEFLLE